MIGSENGIPISMASAPASATARTTSHHAPPSPPVTYGTSNFAPASRRSRSRVSSVIDSPQLSEHFGDLRGILVAPTRKRDEHGRARRYRSAGLAGQPPDRVRRLERGHDALGRAQQLEST